MPLPKGNYLAYQPLRPVNLTVGDFIEKRVDKYIADGQAARAAQLKRAQEEGKALMDMNKEIKIDPISTILPIQQSANKLSKDAIDAKSYAMRIAENTSIPIETRREAYRIAETKATNVLMLNKYLGSKEFVEGYTKKLNTDPSEIWEGDDSIQFINALATGDHDVAFDEKTGSIMVAFPNQDQTSDQKVEWRDFTEIAMKTAQPYEKELSKEIDDFQKSQANNLFIKETNGKGGNRTTIQNKFLRNDALKNFETTFGGFDVNSKDPMLKQFAYSVLGKKQIQSQEDWNTVRDAWVNKLENYVPKEYSVKDEKSAADLEEQKWRIKNAKKNYYTPDSTAAPKESKVSITQAGGITQIDGSGKGRLIEGGNLLNLNNKEYIAVYKVPNSNNKGFHTEYAILGRDEQGRMAFKEKTTRGDAAVRLSGYNIDPIMVEKLALDGPVAKIQGWKNTTSKNIKSFNQAYTPEDDGSTDPPVKQN